VLLGAEKKSLARRCSLGFVRRVELELGVRRGLLGRAAGRVEVEEGVRVRWMGLLVVLVMDFAIVFFVVV